MKIPIRVLFVEDDPEMIDLYAEAFLMPEFQVSSVIDSTQALDLLREPKSKFDILVTDYCIPPMDRVKLLTKVQRDFPDMKFLVTGYNCSGFAGTDPFTVYKFDNEPIKIRELKEIIRKIADVHLTKAS